MRDLIGTPVLRVEDHNLLIGNGSFVADLDLPGRVLHAHFVTSTQAHALIGGIDVTAAATAPGVVDVLTGHDVEIAFLPGRPPGSPDGTDRPVLVTERVRYVGEPIVVIVADTAAAAADAGELVLIDYEPLEAVVRPQDALRDHTLLFPELGSNVMHRSAGGNPAPPDFSDCEIVIEAEIVNQRVAPCPLETRIGASYWTDDGQLVHHASCQSAHFIQGLLASVYELPLSSVRVISRDVGGSFGAKARLYVEDLLLPLLAKRTGCAVRWIPNRSADMVGLGHSRAQHQSVRIGGDRDGTLRAMSLHILADCGAYPVAAPVLAKNTGLLLPGPLAFDQVHWQITAVVTNTTPIVAYRGAGRPEAGALIDRSVDLFAAAIGLDPLDVRRKNLIAEEDLPRTNPTGLVHDSGNYRDALDRVVEAVGYDEIRAEQSRRVGSASRHLGVGLSTFVDKTSGAPGTEYGAVHLQPDATLKIVTGSTPYGQGHHTAWAMLAADRTGIPMSQITVIHGDTDSVPSAGITGGSRSAQMAGSAVAAAADQLVSEAMTIAASLLEAADADVVFDRGAARFHVTGAPAAATVNWADIAIAHAARPAAGELKCEVDFENPGGTVPYGAYAAVVEVDPETGGVSLLRLVTVDDAGTIINPMLALGQVHGGVTQGIAQAMYEEFVYDDLGVPLTTNLADYTMPSAAEVPTFECQLTEHPAPGIPIGAKGIGESGTIGAVPAVQNAVVDALRHLGVRHIDMPCTPERVWRAISDAVG